MTAGRPGRTWRGMRGRDGSVPRRHFPGIGWISWAAGGPCAHPNRFFWRRMARCDLSVSQSKQNTARACFFPEKPPSLAQTCNFGERKPLRSRQSVLHLPVPARPRAASKINSPPRTCRRAFHADDTVPEPHNCGAGKHDDIKLQAFVAPGRQPTTKRHLRLSRRPGRNCGCGFCLCASGAGCLVFSRLR